MNLKEVCETLSREIRKLVPYDRLAINLPEKDENYVRVYAEESRLPAAAIPEGLSVREGTATGWVLDHHEPVVCRDVLQDSRFPLTHKRYKGVGLRSYVILPLMAEGKALGALNLASLRPRCYGKKQVEILSPIAEILSVAVENSILYEGAQRREELQKLFKELSQDITSLDIDSLLKKLTEKVREILKVDVSDVRVFEAGRWILRGVSGIDSDLIPSARTGTAMGRSGWIIKHRRPLVIPDAAHEQNLPSGETIRSLGLRAYLAVPLFSRGGEVIGVLRALGYQPREFIPEEVDLLQQLANGAAIALENAKLFEEAQSKSRELESTNTRLNRLLGQQSALREIFSQINLVDMGPLLDQLTQQALSLLHADHAVLRLLSPDGTLRAVSLAGRGVERVQDRLLEFGKGRSTWIMENQRPLAIMDIHQDKVFGPAPLLQELGARGYLGVPLISRGQKSIGVLTVSTVREREFTEEEIALARQLASAAAVTIENARLFEEVQNKSAELEEAFKAKSAFLNTMAHELKTPLHVIVGMQQLLLEEAYGKITEEQKEALERIERNVRDLLSLIDEILELARLEVRRVPLHIEEFTVNEMIQGLESSLTPLAKEKGLELKIKIEDPSLRLQSDKTKLHAILQNLLSNAIKYTDVGEIELCVSCPRDGEGRVSFTVHDTGIGIQEEDLKQIFDPFYMAGNVDRKKRPGTGLGLTIVKRLVELFEGEIQVESELGKGSTFTVTLPLAHTDGEAR